MTGYCGCDVAPLTDEETVAAIRVILRFGTSKHQLKLIKAILKARS
jgi:hypothetical protein